MLSNKKYELKTANNNFILQIISYEELNNGRSLWLTDLLINEELKNELFNHNTNYLNFNLDNYCFASLNNNFVFIPAEGTSFIINVNTLKVHYLPIVLLSTFYFIGNAFVNNKTIIVYSNLVQIHELEGNTTHLLNFKEEQIAAFSVDSNTVVLKLNSENKIQTKHIPL